MGEMSEQEADTPIQSHAEPLTGVMASIAVQARRTNRVRIDQLRTALARAAEEGLDRAGWAVLERIAHQLAGSAGTFGFAGVSERARQLERLCVDAAAAPPDQERLAAARVLIEEAGAQLDHDPRLV